MAHKTYTIHWVAGVLIGTFVLMGAATAFGDGMSDGFDTKPTIDYEAQREAV